MRMDFALHDSNLILPACFEFPCCCSWRQSFISSSLAWKLCCNPESSAMMILSFSLMLSKVDSNSDWDCLSRSTWDWRLFVSLLRRWSAAMSDMDDALDGLCWRVGEGVCDRSWSCCNCCCLSDLFFFPGVFLLISSSKSFLSRLKCECSNSQVYRGALILEKSKHSSLFLPDLHTSFELRRHCFLSCGNHTCLAVEQN